MLELAVIVLDPPARLGPSHQVGGRCGGGQARYPVVRRSVLAVRPFDEECLDGQDAVPPVAAPPASWRQDMGQPSLLKTEPEQGADAVVGVSLGDQPRSGTTTRSPAG